MGHILEMCHHNTSYQFSAESCCCGVWSYSTDGDPMEQLSLGFGAEILYGQQLLHPLPNRWGLLDNYLFSMESIFLVLGRNFIPIAASSQNLNLTWYIHSYLTRNYKSCMHIFFHENKKCDNRIIIFSNTSAYVLNHP